ncbi:MAG: hypothetical protein HFG79_16735 [Lachnospiraceae bacterium]|jgi:hypothetical protein|nr:hypothetical protein [Lachnospiraceae bacterium]
MKKARCFISYCSSDAKPDDVSAIVRYLDQMARSKEYNIEFLFDKDLSVGNDLNEFMQEIITVDSIIVICTPDYKKKYMNLKEEYVESGVYKECQLMKERISKRNKILEESIEEFDDNDFRIFPLVLSIEGKYSENSVPDFLTSLVREKINQIQFETSKGKRIITQQSKQLYNNIFLDCIISTCVIYSKKSEYLIMDMHEKLQKLIYNQKAEYAPTLDKRLFVNTFYFEQIKSQESYILVGRKGSGKTTTKLYFHSSNKEKYKGVIELRIDAFNLNEIYNYLFHAPYDGNKNLKNDIEEIFTYEKVIEYIWIVYIVLYSMYVVACEYKKSNCILSPTQKKKFKKAVDYVNAVLEIIDSRSRWENGDTISTTIYNYAMANTYNFFNDVIQGSRNDERFFASDIQAQLNHENLLKKVIGRDVIDKFYKGLDECQKRILFTLDGFDVASDMFRKNSLSNSPSEQQQKALFEIKWMSSLMELVQDIKGKANNSLYKLLDICFLLPKDLFMEILEHNRDKYKYGSRFCEISWTGMELAIMVRKRLEVLNNYPLSSKEKKQKLPEEIFSQILEKKYKAIPTKVTVKTEGGREYTVDLFLYMLRYTFWRPRELLLSLSLILNIFYGHSKSGLPINQETIKATIKAASITIINSEFYNEFGTIWKEIKENILQFTGGTLLLNEKEIKTIIMSNKFHIKLSTEDTEIQAYRDKIKFLYEIGFLGIFVDINY